MATITIKLKLSDSWTTKDTWERAERAAEAARKLEGGGEAAVVTQIVVNK